MSVCRALKVSIEVVVKVGGGVVVVAIQTTLITNQLIANQIIIETST